MTSHPRPQEVRLSKRPDPSLIKLLAVSHLAQNTQGDLRVVFNSLVPAHLEERYDTGTAHWTGTARAH